MSYTYLNEDEIDNELKCTICNDPFQSPVCCISCGHTFCQQCIQRWTRVKTSCPLCRGINVTFQLVITRIVHNQLGRLLVQCSQCQQQPIYRRDFNDHISSVCPKQLVTCTENCGWQGHRELLEEHVIQCRQRRFRWWPFSRWWT